MNKKNISPNPQKPVERQPNGKLPSALAELSEAALSNTNAPAPQQQGACDPFKDYDQLCSFDGDEE